MMASERWLTASMIHGRPGQGQVFSQIDSPVHGRHRRMMRATDGLVWVQIRTTSRGGPTCHHLAGGPTTYPTTLPSGHATDRRSNVAQCGSRFGLNTRKFCSTTSYRPGSTATTVAMCPNGPYEPPYTTIEPGAGCELTAKPCARATPKRSIAFPNSGGGDRKSTRLNSSHPSISYAVFCLKKKKQIITIYQN